MPVIGYAERFAFERLGITHEEEMKDVEKSLDASFQTNIYLQPDLAFIGSTTGIGPILEALDFQQLKWAGHGLPPNGNFQWIESEVMKPEAYDELISDPSDFVVRKYWPRAFRKLAVFGSFPPFREIVGYFAPLSGFMSFGTPAGLEALEALKKAGEEGLKSITAMIVNTRRLKEAGFPIIFGAATQPPFDVLGDLLRGRKGIILDMYRRPEKIIKACERLLPIMVETAVSAVKMSGNPRVFIALHGCIEGFMSVEQFKRLYWPTFRELMVALINEGCTPMVFVEGGSNSRLEVMQDVPPGKVWYWFEHVDMVKAKEVMAGKVCIGGNVPLSLLATGTPDQVRAYCKNLIDTVGKDGGYIMASAGSTDDAKIENIKAMIDYTKEYGVY